VTEYWLNGRIVKRCAHCHIFASAPTQLCPAPKKNPGLSRTKAIFQDFPGPGKFTKRNPGLSRRRGNPEHNWLFSVSQLAVHQQQFL